MLVYDHRMVEGSPLRYYGPYTLPPPTSHGFSFFRRFELGSSMETTEEAAVPQSPNSTQSDSDNSISSIEISPKSIQRPSIEDSSLEKRTNIRCCWKSCGLDFESLDQLATHVTRVHSSSGVGGLFYCGWDGCTRNNRGFNARYKMLVHVRTHTNEKPHKCEKCEKSFSRAENLKIHSRSHSGEKPYVCPVPGCNKAYSNSSDRFKHTRTHQVEKPYKCKVPGCPKRYTDPSSLRKHVKTYKHFVSEQNTAVNNAGSEETIPVQATETREMQVQTVEVSPTEEIESNQRPAQITTSEHCACMHSCCVSQNLSKATELLRLEALINFRGEEMRCSSWNGGFLNHYQVESKRPFSSYEIGQSTMEVDMPLDLSIRRHYS